MPDQPLLNMHEAAERIGITRRHLRGLIARRAIRFYKVGGLNMFDPADLDQWLEDNKVEALD